MRDHILIVFLQERREASFDALFGVILTGANTDRFIRPQRLKELGWLVLEQALETIELAITLESAIRFVEVDYIVPLD